MVVSPLFGEEFQFDEHIFQRGWFNHQLVNPCLKKMVVPKPTKRENGGWTSRISFKKTPYTFSFLKDTTSMFSIVHLVHNYHTCSFSLSDFQRNFDLLMIPKNPFACPKNPRLPRSVPILKTDSKTRTVGDMGLGDLKSFST